MDAPLPDLIFPVERADDGLLVGERGPSCGIPWDDDVRESADRATRLLTDWASKEAQLDS